MLLLIIWLAGLAAGSLNWYRRREDLTRAEGLEILLLYQLALSYGFYGLFGFVAQAILPDMTASGVGWLPHYGFQFELAAFELGCGLAAAMSLFFRNRYYWLGVAIPPSVMLPIASVAMARDYLQHGKGWFEVVGVTLPDFGVPLTVGVLLWLIFQTPAPEVGRSHLDGG